MTKHHENSQSLQNFLQVTKTSEPSRVGDNKLHATIEIEWLDGLSAKGIHDLFAAVNSFKTLIELSRPSACDLTDREQKKFAQLSAHAARLEESVEWLAKLVGQG